MTVSDDEIDRLASRLALLVSDDGEADNAGRAIGALARRLGLSGGQLKAIFKAGAAAAKSDSARVRAQQARIADLERELTETRRGLQATEEALEDARVERALAIADLQAHRAALERRGRLAGLRRFGATVVLLALIGGGAFGGFLYAQRSATPGPGLAFAGTVRADAAALHAAPDLTSTVLATLPPGAQVSVRRLFWANLMQWAEVEFEGRTGFTRSTDIAL